MQQNGHSIHYNDPVVDFVFNKYIELYADINATQRGFKT